MKIIQKCYKVWDIKYPEYSQEIYAESAGKAKAKFLREDSGESIFLTLECRRNKSADVVKIGEDTGKLEDLIYRSEWRKWRADIENFGNENKGKECYIYSGQWQSYWRSNGVGYTTQKEYAGTYEVSDAILRVLHCGLEKKIQLQLVS